MGGCTGGWRSATRGSSGAFVPALAMVGGLGLLACGTPGGDEADLPGMSQSRAAATCARLPDGTDARAVDAYERVNMYRLAIGAPCIHFVPEIASAAAAHCEYYVDNHGGCVASPHREVRSCQGFHGERFGERMARSGYLGYPAYEVMTYVGDGAAAVDAWVNSLWHRIPLLSPYVGDVGYGSVAGRCDTMDFGRGATAAASTTIVYPFDKQTGVPTSFDGDFESPAPPRPPLGWPSGYPIIAYASGLEVKRHALYDDHGAALDHAFIAPGDAAAAGLLSDEMVMYAHHPLAKGTAYRVVIEGTRAGSPVHLEWTFTTHA
jgi:uncharacterized protein YkwD